jgi:outer membrane biosynthesis protein TonB
MDAKLNDSASGTAVEEAEDADKAGQENEAVNEAAAEESAAAEPPPADQTSAEQPPAPEQPTPERSAPEQPAEEVPQPRSAEPEAPATASESGAGKAKKRKTAPKSTKAAGTKSLVVFREGKVHYADETVVVLDLDDAAHPDTDVHDVVDKLSELRDAIESPGRTEAVSLVAELIQAKALA